jgi:hypothetical protein
MILELLRHAPACLRNDPGLRHFTQQTVVEWDVVAEKIQRDTRMAVQPAPQQSNSVRLKVRHHTSRAREAWKKYYHYKRLEAHGNPSLWHGRKRRRRMFVTALIWAAVIAYGLYHTVWRGWY